MATANFGRLEKLDLREGWLTEHGGFTPWLASEENLALLSDVIGIDLDCEAQEKDVGPFRADILCKDTATDHWVLIENQLERTDHGHLGQLLTYAAGLKAVTIVWIAARFTDEHRAALDWLNEISDERFNFFGLEIELWRIGGSPVAPKFNVVCKPNTWSEGIRASAEHAGLSTVQELRLAYWTEFREYLLKRKSVLKPQKPQPQMWANFAIGRSGFHLFACISTQKKFIGVGLPCTGANGKEHFRQLAADKQAIEADAGIKFDWKELPHRKESKITVHRDVDPANRNDWPSQHAWLADTLEIFHRTFSQRVKELGAEEDDDTVATAAATLFPQPK